MRVVKFYYNNDPRNIIQYGMIAEEMVDVLPELVAYDNDIPFSVKYHLLAPLMIAELQQHEMQIKVLNDRINPLEERINQLEALIQALIAK